VTFPSHLEIFVTTFSAAGWLPLTAYCQSDYYVEFLKESYSCNHEPCNISRNLAIPMIIAEHQFSSTLGCGRFRFELQRRLLSLVHFMCPQGSIVTITRFASPILPSPSAVGRVAAKGFCIRTLHRIKNEPRLNIESSKTDSKCCF